MNGLTGIADITRQVVTFGNTLRNWLATLTAKFHRYVLDTFEQGIRLKPARPLGMVGDIYAIMSGLLLQIGLQILQQFGIE